MSASLPMYWRAETADAWRDFWVRVQDLGAERGLALPDLTAPEDLPASWYDHWLDPELVLSQTCGLPFRSTLKGKVTYVVTPDFGVEGCPPGYYNSVALRRTDGGDGMRLARNGADSQSGWAAACQWRDIHGPAKWDAIIDTGAHAASAQAVADGVADIAFVDAVTWRLVAQDADLASRLTCVGHTPPTPALPLITAQGRDPNALREVLQHAMESVPSANRARMGGLRGFVEIAEQSYFDVPLPPSH